MRNVYKEISLGPEAITYMRERLEGGHTLARYLLDRDDLDRGRIITFVPPDLDVSEESARRFEDGGLIPEPPPETHIKVEGGRMVPLPKDTHLILLQIIQEFLASGMGRVCLFEDAVGDPSDPRFSPSDASWLAFNKEIYYFLSNRDTDSRKIEKVINEAFNFYPGLIGIMASIRDNEQVNSGGNKITLNQLKVFAVRTEKIILGAYDGEGYLIWTKG